jgi:immune inhibitor A
MRRLAVFFITFLIMGSCLVQGLTISPQLREKLQREGAWEEFAKMFRQWQERQDSLLEQERMFRPMAKLSPDAVTTMHVVVILVDFSDKPADAGVSGVTPADFNDLLFSQNPSSPRSFTDFYLENSYGKLKVEGGVYGWYRMPRLYSDYVGTGYGMQNTTPNAQTMVIDALYAADPDIDFSAYENPNTGVLDAVFVVHAGTGAEEGGDTHSLWSHRSTINAFQSNEGTIIRSYFVAPEEEFGHISYVGVYCHEFGHIIGLPDLYDVSDASYPGVGAWSLMATGSWNGNGRWPAHLDAWSKYDRGFGKTVVLDGSKTDAVLGASVTDTLRYKIILSGSEYFMVENRQQTGFDKNLPASGLLIMHIDDNFTGSNNIRRGHYRIAVEQADGQNDLEANRNEGDAYDVFPGPAGLFTEFTTLTKPSSSSYYAAASQVSVWNIRHNTTDKTITCNMEELFSRYNLQLTTKTFNDSVYGNNDGVLMPGEKVRLYYTIKNNWKAANSVNVKITSPTVGLTFVSNQNSFGNLAIGAVKSDSTAPVEFTLASGMSPANARFDVAITTTSSPADTFRTSFYRYVGGIDVLLVDDDGGDESGIPMDRESYYKATLDSLGIPYDYRDVKNTILPDTTELKNYHYVIWFTGDDRGNVLNSARVALLTNFLDRGGRLFLTGQNIAEQLSVSADSTFLRDYLRAGFVENCQPAKLLGTPFDPIGQADSIYVTGADGASNQLSSDVLTVLNGANVPYKYDIPSHGAASTAFASQIGYRVVFFGFGLESVTSTRVGSTKRTTLFQRVMDFLGSSQTTDVEDDYVATPLPKTFDLNQNYPNPFNPSTVISYEIGARANGQHYALDIFNIMGQKVATLASGIARTGSYRVEFDAGSQPSGVYLYRLTVGGETVTRKMVLTK